MKMRSCKGLLVAAMLAGFAAVARGDEPAKTTAITLGEVTAFPEAYRRVPFDLELLYHGPRNVYNPFFTIFEPSSWANFAAWPGDTPLFRREAYLDDHPLFYVERRSDALQRAVMEMKPYTWFTASCIVRSTAQGRAWIEVLAIKSTGAVLDPVDLRHLVRAQSLANGGNFERALVEHSLARLLNVPPRFVARCRLEEGRVALAANQPERAMTALQQAWPQLQDDKQVAALLDRASAQVALLRDQDVAQVGKPAPPPAPAAAPKDSSPPVAPPPTPSGDAPSTPPAKPVTETPGDDAAPDATEPQPAETRPPSEESGEPSEPLPPVPEADGDDVNDVDESDGSDGR
ncbi:MAG: hypothetical protein FJ293_04520 [Planctomycetes bacterium]|nr:hypothetical protein [Planctomycetota bacterium]